MSVVAFVTNDPGMDRELSTELADHTIQVSSIALGPTASPMFIVESLPTGGDLVVVVAADIPADRALAVLEHIDRNRPTAATVLVTDSDSALLRRAMAVGVRSVISPTAPPEELADTVREVMAWLARRRQVLVGVDGDPERRVLSVLSAKGGTGKTTVASNVAIALATVAPGQVVLVDFDLQFGDVEYALRLKPEQTIADLGRARDRVDATSVKAFLTAHPSGVFALCAPSSPAESEDLSAVVLDRVIDLLASQFRYVVIDTAGGIDDASLVAMDHATDLLLMSSTDIPSVRALQKTVHALGSLGFADRNWHYILNRSDAKVGLTPDDVREAIGMPIDLAIPDTKAMTLAMNQGSPLIETDPRAAASKKLTTFVQRFIPEIQAEPVRKSAFSLRSSR